ncbi:copper resistance protein B [Lysobacter sp. FW306-1B-D06B]|uniref:copper resistance protein B n=1 Tax=Lysobacter sp. FW306-1B-D06B TaxID=3140250 RepID=UPI00314018A6
MRRTHTLLAFVLAAGAPTAWAQHASHAPTPPPTTHDHDAHPAPTTPPADAHDHAQMGHAMDAPREPVEPIAPITDADRAAAFPALQHDMHHASEWNSFVLIDRLEAVDLDHGRGEAWEAQAWFGTDTDRLWLRSEGERERGVTESADLEVLYGRSVSAWWDVVAGLKHDFKPGDARDWAAIGVQGMAPYKFEVSATAYVGERGATAARLEAEYELLLTNRLILQPRVEATLYGKDDPDRGIGSGLSSLEAGLRLRYEVTRRFAPYVGVGWERAYGDTADHRREEGEPVEDTRLLAGLRLWF